MSLFESVKKNLKESQKLTEADITPSEKAVAKALDYIKNEYNELGSDDKYFLLAKLTKGTNPDAQVKAALNYIKNEYNEIGSDDRYFLENILEKGLRRVEKEKATNERKEKGITGYSNKGKKQDVIKDFTNALSPEIIVTPPAGNGDNTIKFNKDGDRIGIRAYLQSKNLPDDSFGLSFNKTTAKKYIDSLGGIYKLSDGPYDSNVVGYDFYKFKLKDIPKIANEIKNILNSNINSKNLKEDEDWEDSSEWKDKEVVKNMPRFKKDLNNILEELYGNGHVTYYDYLEATLQFSSYAEDEEFTTPEQYSILKEKVIDCANKHNFIVDEQSFSAEITGGSDFNPDLGYWDVEFNFSLK